MKVTEYTIQLQTYHDEIVARLQYVDANGALQESELYSLAEIQLIIALWQYDALQGSFGIGSRLSHTARFLLVQK